MLREAFKDLLKAWGRQQELVFAAEFPFVAPDQSKRAVDGALIYPGVRLPFGYWEAKDERDDLDAEIAAKFAVGYPRDNIVFSDDVTAVLYQDGTERRRCSMLDEALLAALLEQFFSYQRPEFAEFSKARRQFRQDLPQVLDALRAAIDEADKTNPAYKTAAAEFLAQARASINPRVTAEDVREMLIQHILTEDIFNHVFDQTGYHRENNVAQALGKLEATFFKGDLRQRTVERLKSYYSGLRASAAKLEGRSEKQKLLKDVYEDFYRTYNPKAADRLGVVYTPTEIVRFMIESADWLCEKHFSKTMIHPDVEILDPATGTGTFIVELLEHFGGQAGLKAKYADGLHANEVAILPYYVANLNIESTYRALTGEYAEFPGLCFVDTLDNIGGIRDVGATQAGLIGSITAENNDRIRRQNERKISVVIGNPPYNAWQADYSQDNANIKYDVVDQRIKESYVRLGTAQNQNSVYDMYTRFVRWATDRLPNEGVLAFVMGRKPFSKAAYDGFRQTVWREFSDIYVVDLGGDVRDNPRLSGTTHNVFGIQTGVAIAFLVKKGAGGPATIRYARRPEMETAAEKLSWLSGRSIADAGLQTIQPDVRNHDWIEQQKSEWTALVRLAISDGHQGIFEQTSNGVETKKDEWLYDWNVASVAEKTQFYVSAYNATEFDPESDQRASIKWDRETERGVRRSGQITWQASYISGAAYRPFVRRYLYRDPKLVSVMFNDERVFPQSEYNTAIGILGIATQNPLAVLATDKTLDRCFLKNGNGGTQLVSRYKFTQGERVDNITDWALNQFWTRYPDDSATKDDIFAYVYAALHDPVYRETYALNLRREFPRIPLHPEFSRWRDWGRTLLDLHIGYEAVEPWELQRDDAPLKQGRRLRAGESKDLLDKTVDAPRPKLKSKPAEGVIEIDTSTTLSGVPSEAWRYRLGNRSAIDWVLDQHKEKTPRDPTIRAKFNTYRFADHKEHVIDLLARVVRVSVETVAITEAMRGAKR